MMVLHIMQRLKESWKNNDRVCSIELKNMLLFNNENKKAKGTTKCDIRRSIQQKLMHMEQAMRPYIQLLNVIIQENNTKMINFDDITRENIKEDNPNWPQIPDYQYRILIIGSSGSEKINLFLNLISQQPDIDQFYQYV